MTDSLHLSIDSFSSIDGIGGASFFITPSPGGDVSINDLRFVEYSSHLRDVLVSLGLRDYQSHYDNADLAIILTYTVLPPLSRSTIDSRPVYGTQGGGTITYSGTSWSPDGPIMTSGTIHSMPQYGVVGTRTTERTTTVYGGAVMVLAADWKNKTEDTLPTLWKCQIIYSSFQPLSQRQALPLALKAAANHFGAQPGKTISIELPLAVDFD